MKDSAFLISYSGYNPIMKPELQDELAELNIDIKTSTSHKIPLFILEDWREVKQLLLDYTVWGNEKNLDELDMKKEIMFAHWYAEIMDFTKFAKEIMYGQDDFTDWSKMYNENQIGVIRLKKGLIKGALLPENRWHKDRC